MKQISWMTNSLRAAIFLTALVSPAVAGCGDWTALQNPTAYQQQAMNMTMRPKIAAAKQQTGNPANPSIVGMWSVQYVAQGNSTRTPPIPDGTIVDFGYSQWHSDGTEMLNSGGHSPATENFCMGVWGQTGFLTYELNHFALSYDLTSQTLTAYVNIREQVTLSPSGDMYAGTFTIDVYSTAGTHVDHIAGNITGQRITVDSKPI
jgi:hypothetical protein